jgi:hypothetical protein
VHNTKDQDRKQKSDSNDTKEPKHIADQKNCDHKSSVIEDDQSKLKEFRKDARKHIAAKIVEIQAQIDAC